MQHLGLEFRVSGFFVGFSASCFRKPFKIPERKHALLRIPILELGPERPSLLGALEDLFSKW